MKLNQIRQTLEERLLSLWNTSTSEAYGSALPVPALLPPGQPRAPQPDRIVLRWHTAFGEVFPAEKNGLSRRVGSFVLTLQAPADTSPDEALELAATLEILFHRAVLPIDGHRLVCAEPHTVDAGLSAEKRPVIVVTVPWFVYF